MDQEKTVTAQYEARSFALKNLSLQAKVIGRGSSPTNVSAASSAAELQKVVLTHMKTQAVDSIEKGIEHTQAKVSENENRTDGSNENITELSDKITELTTLMDDINAAESLEDLKEIMSLQGMPRMGHEMGHEMGHGMCPEQDPMQHGGNFPMCPEKMPENSTEA